MRIAIAITALSPMLIAALAPGHPTASNSVQDSISQGPQPSGNGVRATIVPGGTLEFNKLKIVALATAASNAVVGRAHTAVTLRLEEDGETQEITFYPPQSSNWHGYHVAVPLVHESTEPGGVRIELGVWSVASLPQCVGKPIGKDQPWPCR